MTDLVNWICDILNIKTDNTEELDIQMAFVHDLILKKFWMLTIPEVKEAFKMYVSGDFGLKVFRLLDCVSIGEVLAKYIEFRNNALSTYEPNKPTAKLEAISKSGQDEICRNGINTVFSEFKATKELPTLTEWIFDFLVEKGLLKLATESTPKLTEYYQKKTAEVTETLKLEKESEKKQAKRNNDLGNLTTVKEKLAEIEIGQSREVYLRVKKIVLREYFEKRISENAENIF